MSRIKINEIDSQRFYQIPKSLFNNDQYKGMSLDAKVIYAVLRDRMELSRKNNWINSNNEIYLMFTKANIAELIGCSEPVVYKATKQLIKFGLIEEKRQGLGKPNIIYINHIEQTIENTKNLKILSSRTKEFLGQDIKNINTSDTDNINTNISETKYNDNGVNFDKLSTYCFDQEVIELIKNYTHELYVQKTGKQHPRLKINQHKQIYNNINNFMNEYCVDYNGMADMMVQFLNSNIDSDWNINHFATEGMMLNRMYEVKQNV